MGRIADLERRWGRLKQYWTHDLWRIERTHPDLSFTARLGVLGARSLFIVVSGFRGEKVRLRAASLTYVSLLSLVPAIAVVFSVFTAFGGLDTAKSKLKGLIIDALAVNQREAVLEYLDRFVAQTNASRLGTFGSVFLVLTVISLLTNIERAFNDIWGIRKARSYLQRFQVYWPVVTLGPIVVGLSLSVSAAVEASGTVKAITEVAPSFQLLIQLGPLVLTWLFFAFLYKVLPNTQVRFRSALAGGFVGGTLWTVAERLYAIYAANAITYSAIYGSLGAVPLFVIWVYVSWTVILLGAALTFAIQSVRTFEPDRPVSQDEREQVAARLMLGVATAYHAGRGALAADDLLEQVPAPPRLAREVLGDLVQAGLLAEIAGDDSAFVPGRPLDQLTLGQIVEVMRHGDATPPDKALGHFGPTVDAALGKAFDAAQAELSVTLAELVASQPPVGDEAPQLRLQA